MTRSSSDPQGAPGRRKGENSLHDHGYKLLFSQPKVVEELLRGFLPAAWVDRLDFSTLRRGSGSVVSDDLRERHDDVIWSLSWRVGKGKEHRFWIYLLLELQSKPDRYMAVRLLTYVGLLLQDLIRTKQLEPGGLLPPVLPIVLYHGKPKWWPPLDLASLFAPVPREVKRHLPQLSYRLLDAGRLPLDRPALRDNLVAAALRLETTEALEAVSRLEDLRILVPADLRRVFDIWLDARFRRYPFGAKLPPGTINLESGTMLEETFKEWEQKMLSQGHREGHREGRREGRREGQVEGLQKAVLQTLRERFGPVPRNVRRRVQEVSSVAELTKLLRRSLTARSLQETGIL